MEWDCIMDDRDDASLFPADNDVFKDSSGFDNCDIEWPDDLPIENMAPQPSIRKSDLPDGWSEMPDGAKFHMEVLFDKSDGNISGLSEAVTVAYTAFPSCMGGMFKAGPSQEVFETIKDRSNYDIVKVERVQNLTQTGMHGDFQRRYEITNPRTVYHGTTLLHSTLIAKTGFRGALSRRAKFGKGIYTSSNIWEAISYSEPEKDFTQTLLVVTLLQGSTTVGTPEMGDFGEDAMGDQILTTTNPENTIFCASHGNQLLACYRVTVCFDRTTAHTLPQQTVVRVYHPAVWNIVRMRSQPPPPTKPLFALPSPGDLFLKSIPPAFSDSTGMAMLAGMQRLKDHGTINACTLECHRKIKVGESVIVKDMFVTLKFCEGAAGHIRAIVKDGKVTYYVQTEDPGIIKRMEVWTEKNVFRTGLMAKFKIDKSWIPCTFMQISKTKTPPPVAQKRAVKRNLLATFYETPVPFDKEGRPSVAGVFYKIPRVQGATVP